MALKKCECCGQVLPSEWELVADRVRLSPKQRLLFLAVARGEGRSVNWSAIENALYGDDLDGGPLAVKNTVYVIANHANARLRKEGYRITGDGKGVRAPGLRLVTLSSPQ